MSTRIEGIIRSASESSCVRSKNIALEAARIVIEDLNAKLAYQRQAIREVKRILREVNTED